jgi:uncharacterized protein (DUF302 family)
MAHRIRHPFLFLLLFWIGLARAEPVPEPMILTATAQGRGMKEVILALNDAVAGRNYGFLRFQAIDSRLVPYGQEVRSMILFYFCNYAGMSRLLKLDPRAAQLLPYRVTLVETPTGVDLIAVNPAWLTQAMDHPDLREASQSLKLDYQAILEEAAW